MEKKKLNIGIVGHVDHGSTTLTHVAAVLADQKLKELKTIQDIIEEERAIEITSRLNIPQYEFELKDGKQKRRERRAHKRKSK